MWSGELRRQPPHDARVGAPAAADLCRVGPPEASRPGGSESSSVRLEVDVRDSGWPSMSVSASGSMPAVSLQTVAAAPHARTVLQRLGETLRDSFLQLFGVAWFPLSRRDIERVTGRHW